MNITKGDVQELRRRLKKTECTFGRLCGCYVNSGKQIVTKFTEQFSELEEDEYYKYLEIAKKTFSGTLGANLLELEFDRSDSGIEHQKYLLTLKDSKLANEELLDRLYEQVIEEYSYPGNYLIVVYHDVYDVPEQGHLGRGPGRIHRAVCVLRVRGLSGRAGEACARLQRGRKPHRCAGARLGGRSARPRLCDTRRLQTAAAMSTP